jgi:hypothetical protein
MAMAQLMNSSGAKTRTVAIKRANANHAFAPLMRIARRVGSAKTTNAGPAALKITLAQVANAAGLIRDAT